MEKRIQIKDEDLGYSAFFEEARNRLSLGDFPVARVIFESKGAYKIKNERGEMLAKVTGKRMFTSSSREDYPAVGDWVAISELGDGKAVIAAVLPRLSTIKRRHGDKSRTSDRGRVQIIATNVDAAFVVQSADRDYSPNRFERYIAILEEGGVRPILVLNKTDLLSREELDGKLSGLRERFPGVEVVAMSAGTGGGLEELKGQIEKGKTYCFLGSSGVGKSSLINRLIGTDAVKTGGISAYSDRGKHVTTSRQMYFLSGGGIVIDNPGVREVGLADVGVGVDAAFDEIAALAAGCRYTDCMHMHEPGCAVVAAVASGEIDERKYLNYIGLKKEVEHYEADDAERREKDKRFGKLMKNAKKDFKNIGHKDY